MMEITKKLAEDLSRINELTPADVDQLHRLIIDFYAAAYAGYKQNRAFNTPVEETVFARGGAGESFVFGQTEKYPAGCAAFMNALYGHGAELDDGSKKAMGHIGVHVIPAVFALADKLKKTNDEVLTALAVGYETYIRVSSAAQPGMVARGFHSTGMAGTLACAAACAKLYGLDADGIENAIALSTTMTGGLLSYGDSRPAIKPLNPAKAAENGLFAAQLASGGVKGPTEALEGPNGWFHAVTDKVYPELLEGKDRLLLHECYFKLYPSCRHTHCGIEAAVGLHGELQGRAIKAVRVYIYPNAIKLAGQIRYPKDQDETKFSIHYTLSCALLNGRYGVADMDPPDLSKRVTDLIEKIELIPDERMENREKGIRGTRVTVETEDGGVFEKTVSVPKGDPENPLSTGDIIEKLRVCAAGQANEETLARLTDAIYKIEGKDIFDDPTAYVTVG